VGDLVLDFSDYISLWPLLEWMGVWSLIGGLGMIVDKAFSQHGFGRISEKTFFVTALIGGFAGIIIGGLVAGHKTSKGEFWVPVGLAAVLWLAFLLLYFFPSLFKF
jgi:uncharacterized membrane protein YsdA (DUF1294 family)